MNRLAIEKFERWIETINIPIYLKSLKITGINEFMRTFQFNNKEMSENDYLKALEEEYLNVSLLLKNVNKMDFFWKSKEFMEYLQSELFDNIYELEKNKKIKIKNRI